MVYFSAVGERWCSWFYNEFIVCFLSPGSKNFSISTLLNPNINLLLVLKCNDVRLKIFGLANCEHVLWTERNRFSQPHFVPARSSCTTQQVLKHIFYNSCRCDSLWGSSFPVSVLAASVFSSSGEAAREPAWAEGGSQEPGEAEEDLQSPAAGPALAAIMAAAEQGQAFWHHTRYRSEAQMDYVYIFFIFSW